MIATRRLLGLTVLALVSPSFAQDKPKSIQARPGFAEALVQAADGILAAEAGASDKNLAQIQTNQEPFHVTQGRGLYFETRLQVSTSISLSGMARPNSSR